MSNRSWMPLHIADYLADTGHLTAAEHGAYLLLIMHYWQKGGLPSDERMIARIAKLSREEWDESRDVLAAFFGEGWSHKRIGAELAKADEIIGKRKAAADARHSRSKSDAHAVHMHSTCSDTGALPITNNLSSSLRSDDTAPAKPTPRHHLEAVLDEERAGAVLDHRKRIGKPMTAHGAKLLAAKFAQCPDPNAAADAMIANGWQGFEPGWLERREVSVRAPPKREDSVSDVIARLKTEMAQADDEPNPYPDRNRTLALAFSEGEYRRNG